MTPSEWAIFGGFVAMELGLSILNKTLAIIVGAGVGGVIFLKYLDTKGSSTT